MSSELSPPSIEALQRFTSSTYFQEGLAWFKAGRVEVYERRGSEFEGRVSIRDRAQICRFRLDGSGNPVSNCPCRVCRQEGMICGYIIAILLAWRRDEADPQAERLERIEAQMKIPPERRRHFRKLGSTGIASKLKLSLRKTWAQEIPSGSLHFIPSFEVDGRERRPDQLHPTQILKLSEADQRRLILLEDLCQGPLKPVFEVPLDQAAQVFSEFSPGELHILGWPQPLSLRGQAQLPLLHVRLLEESGELELTLRLELPGKRAAGSSPLLLLAKQEGWVISGAEAWPLEALPPGDLQGLTHGSMKIGRERIFPFLEEELPKLEQHMLVDNNVDQSRFEESDCPPGFRLQLKGGQKYCSGTLHAVYGERSVLAGTEASGVFVQPDPERPLAYGGRNPAAEAEALAKLQEFGFAASSGDRLGTLEGKEQILNLLAALQFELEPAGWTCEVRGDLEGLRNSAAFLLADLHIDDSEDPDWYRMDLRMRDSRGSSITEAALRRALNAGKDYLETADGIVLLPRQQGQAIVDCVAECKPGADGSLRLHKRSSSYVQQQMAEDAGIPLRASGSWMRRVQEQREPLRLADVELPPALTETLRPYQEEGVRWLRFLEQGGYGGILADDMGLGKTLQALSWLSLTRHREEAQGCALVVCPSSLVQNWVEECGRFFPELRCHAIVGSSRAALWDQCEDADLAVTSYGLLRRDQKKACERCWSALILDEAQHIKNPGTQNAKAAKTLNAESRVVLTGTPMENRVLDLWSLMDFLMPGYLGTEAQFKKRFGAPIQAGGAGAQTRMHTLRKKIQPFLLRRLKREVARDLPPRLERRMDCDMLPAQRKLYDQTEAALKQEVQNMNSGSPRLEVLQGLMRLRQICNHPGLVNQEAAELESGKIEMFRELMGEIIDGGHRVLVFSQFTKMLGLLREELEKEEIPFLYLDGSTKNRQDLVHEFNGNEEIPVFLISLMAGGTGLNLTGADVVLHMDPWWNPMVEDQATDRAHRIGQEKSVYSLKLITRDSIESRVAALQERKREQIEQALGNDQALVDSLDWNDMKALLAL